VGAPLILYIVERTDTAVHIPLLRMNSAFDSRHILRYLLHLLLKTAADEHRQQLRITQTGLQQAVTDILKEDAFEAVENAWVKIALSLAADARTAAQQLEQIIDRSPVLHPRFSRYLETLRDSHPNSHGAIAANLESIFWPLKITDANLDTLTIPIKAVWASSWFDETLAQQTLFGADAERAFNREGVYYSSGKKPAISLPCRILWYVTKEVGHSGTQAIRACSRLDEIIVGTPADLYRRFRHLGIYEWKNILDLAEGDSNRLLTAYRFSETYLFKHPIALERWTEVTLQVTGKQPPIYSAAVTPPEVFKTLIRIAMDSH
jgi:hypothetical protein